MSSCRGRSSREGEILPRQTSRSQVLSSEHGRSREHFKQQDFSPRSILKVAEGVIACNLKIILFIPEVLMSLWVQHSAGILRHQRGTRGNVKTAPFSGESSSDRYQCLLSGSCPLHGS